jgi:hypothetical protein
MVGQQFELGQLGHTLDQVGDLFAEPLGDVGLGGRGVLDDIVQEGGDDGGGVEAIVGQDARHLDRVGEIGIAGRAHLRAVHPHRVHIGAIQQRLVGRGIIALDPLDQLILAQVFWPDPGGIRLCGV